MGGVVPAAARILTTKKAESHGAPRRRAPSIHAARSGLPARIDRMAGQDALPDRCAEEPPWPSVALGLLRVEILADPPAPPAPWVTERSDDGPRPGGVGSGGKLNVRLQRRFGWRRRTI